ncbi:sugar ABC transporter permease [Arthrobacter tumbae]|uniref:carbohydrate ABC transporter permease n=1 Tax=Arthrobacter tumbae TaxID=163874 RepID=UPI001EF84C34|nr:sugar ABC transporter permease [Arthrobacter tumbae]MBM7781753.1 multiple sugar transport system permease protein [Arthrobacter tumbae]
MARREDLTGRALVTPTVLVVALVVLLPFLASVVFAFLDLDVIDIGPLGTGSIEFTLANFTAAVTSSGFWSALWTTLIYAAATTIGSVVVGLAVSLALRKPFRGRGIIRGLVLVPYVLPVVAAVMIWQQLLNTQYGVVNALGEQFFGWTEPISFLSTTSQDLAGIPVPVTLIVVVLFEIWKSAPLAYLFITARLLAVPRDTEEAALIDGAAPSQQLRYVLLPQLYGVLALLGVLRFIWSFQNFNDIYLLTGGAGGTQVLAVRVYEELTTQGDIGSASALGLIMMVVLSVFLLIYVRMSRKEVSQ